LSLLSTASRRHLLEHPGQLCLCLLGIALGVATVVAIDLALKSAQQAFEQSISGITGNATHSIIAGSEGVPEELYRDLRLEAGLRECAPVVEGEIRILSTSKIPLQALEPPPVRTLLGLDLYAEAGFRSFANDAAEGNISKFLTTPGAAMLEESAAESLGVAVGDRLEISIVARRHHLEVVGTWRATNDRARRASARLVLVDIATAQELLQKIGHLDRIDLNLGSTDAPIPSSLSTLLPDSVEIVPTSDRAKSFEAMTQAFRLNLQALGLLSLVVGIFLIHQTVTVSVLSRRMLWGRLRAYGVRKRELVQLILTEALTFGIAGTALGLLAGIALGRGLTAIVRATIEDLYSVLGEEVIEISSTSLVKAALLGLAASLLSALIPAIEASRTDLRAVLARSSLEASARRNSRKRAVGAVALFALAVLFVVLPTRHLVAGYGSLLAVLLAFALATPWLVQLLINLSLRSIGRRVGLVGRMALHGISAQLSRTGLAIAALAIAVSMSVGVSTMIGSFRGSLIDWLEDTLPADVYIGAASAVARYGARLPLPEAISSTIGKHPATERVIENRHVELPSEHGLIRISVLSADTPANLGLPLEQPISLESWLAGTPPGLLISEPFSHRYRVGTGDQLALRTDQGMIDFEVLGIFRDYSSDLGYVAISRPTFEKYHSVEGATSIAIFLKEGDKSEEVANELENLFAEFPGLRVRPTAALRRETLEIFDRTFRVTEVIRWLAMIVAAIGIFGALVTLELDRAREFGVLRATGLTTREVTGLILFQTGGLGVIAGVIAIPLGVISAAILTMVVNERSFGWSIELTVEPGPLLSGIGLATGAALLAGLLPARSIGRTQIPEALRETES